MKTKKFVFPLTAVIVVLVLVLVACGAKSSTSTLQTGSSNTTAANGTPVARNFTTQPLPLAESLVIGTFKLEGTSNAITPAQAAALVPLWQAYAQLTSSNTAAQAEIDAVIAQIQSTMTPQQVQAITAMKLTRQDLFTTESSLGLSNGFGANGTRTPRAPSTNGGGGGFFTSGGGGGFAGGGAGGNGAARPTPNATQQALRAQFANRIPTPLMNALISLLQNKG
jgi:hypothetical protein